jgi:hypothetical protein
MTPPKPRAGASHSRAQLPLRDDWCPVLANDPTEALRVSSRPLFEKAVLPWNGVLAENRLTWCSS